MVESYTNPNSPNYDYALKWGYDWLCSHAVHHHMVEQIIKRMSIHSHKTLRYLYYQTRYNNYDLAHTQYEKFYDINRLDNFNQHWMNAKIYSGEIVREERGSNLLQRLFTPFCSLLHNINLFIWSPLLVFIYHIF